MSATCIQRRIAHHGPRSGQMIDVRRPHVPVWPAEPHEDVAPGECGYTRCAECGQKIYAQRPDTDEARALRRFVGGPDA